MTGWDDLLRYYQSELGYLNRAGQEFARQYPKVAARLELTPEGSADPQIERMIGSFAFLTARIQRQMDSEFPEISTALLSTLHPQLVNPVPSMAVAHFEVDPGRGKITSGYRVPRSTSLFAQGSTGLFARFQTSYDVTLWPLQVVDAGFESAAQFGFLDGEGNVAGVLRIRLKASAGSLGELELSRLRFYLEGDAALVNSMYELLFAHELRAGMVRSDGRSAVWLPSGSLSPVGFAPEEEVIPCPPNALPGYRLLQEYFLFPRKFHFFDVAGLDRRPEGETLDLVFLLDALPRRPIPVGPENFRLGCTPIINLFRKTTEPVRLDGRQFEYRLDPDYRKERTTEIHSIVSVSSSSNPAEETTKVEPFFSHRHRFDGRGQNAFWHARRVPSERKDLPGTDILISFVDLDFHPMKPPSEVVYAHTLCTNRDFAVQLPPGATLHIEDAGPFAGIRCLTKPTWPAYPPLGGATVWQLISNLSLNYLSLSGGPQSLEAFREIMRLYSLSDQPSVSQQIQGIAEMACRPVTRRLGRDAWRGFCQGTEVTVTLDEAMYAGAGGFLLGAVLNHFFALYAHLNSFTELVVRSRQREGVWKRYPPMAGAQPLV